MKQEGPSCKSDTQIRELADAMRTLADPNRLRIMCFLSSGEKCVCEVERELGISQQLASHHLNVLKDTGLLRIRKEGTWSYYSIDENSLDRTRELFVRYLGRHSLDQVALKTANCQ